MHPIASAIIVASAVISVTVAHDRTQRRIDELHRHYQLKLEQAFKDGRRSVSMEPIVTPPTTLLEFSDPAAKSKDRKSIFRR